MTNILLNINNFGDEFSFNKLKRIIKKHHNVLIIPFSYHEDYIRNAEEYTREFSKGSREIEDIIKEFVKFGIRRKNIRILHYYNDSSETIRNKFKHADIIFFTGGYPGKALYRIDTLGIRDYIANFKGIVMGTSAGAMIQLDKYHVTPEENGEEYEYHENGLGLISGFDIEVHYEPDFLHLSGLITDLKLHDVKIYAMPNTGGLIIRNGKITKIGDTFEITRNDIETLQNELNSLLDK